MQLLRERLAAAYQEIHYARAKTPVKVHQVSCDAPAVPVASDPLVRLFAAIAPKRLNYPRRESCLVAHRVSFAPEVFERDQSMPPVPLRDQIAVLLERQPHCLECLAAALRHPRDDVAATLNELRRALRLREQAGICPPCGEVKMTYRVGDPPLATRR